MQSSFSLFALLALCPGVALARGVEHPFPLEQVADDPAIDALRFTAVTERLSALASLEAVTLAGVPLPDGSVVSLELTRLRHERNRFTFYVDDVPATGLLDGLDLSLWKGHVAGESNTEVMLSFSRAGSQGWIARGDELVHVMPRPDSNGRWEQGDVLFVTESALNSLGMRFDGTCSAKPPIREQLTVPREWQNLPNSENLVGPGCSLRECKISLTSDFQYYQKFNSLAAETAYTTTLWSFVSDRYETQANTILTFPYVAFYTTAADPWIAQDTAGNNCVVVLNELQAAWVGNVPNGGRIGHLLSGANLGCGVAWLDVLCDNTFNFSVSGNLTGTISFPIVQQPNNWDFIVTAHELGHNFNALHTHDYCPPLDECPPSQYFGQCQTQQVCSNQGSIMSYCHLCSGGTGNITTFFHPTSAQFMTASAAACLPLYAGLSGSTPTLLAPATATAVTATIAGTPSGAVQLFWRAGPSGAFTAVNMTSQGSGTYAALLPGFGCADSPQFYYAFTEQTCGLLTFPSGAPANTLQADVGTLQVTLNETFQTDTGWTPTNVGATAGDWQRGVPVNDPAWAYDPTSDGDGSGSCWLTQNTLGNSDVDTGSVVLVSSPLDLSGANAQLDYRYYLRLTNTDGTDKLLVEISANGTGGPWTAIASHTQDTGSAWPTSTIQGSAISALGVTLGANMRLRFTANDGGTQSIVEAGLDGLRIARVTCAGLGVNYCTSTPNSGGGAAVMSATGTNDISTNNLVLRANPVPANSNGLFFFGQNPTQTSFGNGFRCIASPVFRLGISPASGGALTRSVNLAQAPASNITAGSTWNFQAWFRDVAGGGSNFNLSDGYRITFVP